MPILLCPSIFLCGYFFVLKLGSKRTIEPFKLNLAVAFVYLLQPELTAPERLIYSIQRMLIIPSPFYFWINILSLLLFFLSNFMPLMLFIL